MLVTRILSYTSKITDNLTKCGVVQNDFEFRYSDTLPSKSREFAFRRVQIHQIFIKSFLRVMLELRAHCLRTLPSVKRAHGKKTSQALFFVTFIAIFFQGCMHQVTIQSEPSGADIWLLNPRTPGRTSLGKTPLINRSLQYAGTAVVELEKQGFLTKQIAFILIPGANIAVATRLQPITADYLAEKSRRDFAESLNKNLDEMRKLQSVIGARIPEILELQTLIIEQKKEEVILQEKRMKDAWAGISSFHLLMGDFFLSEGNTNEARIRFQRAIAIDPQNPELQKRIQSLPAAPANNKPLSPGYSPPPASINIQSTTPNTNNMNEPTPPKNGAQ